MSFIDEMQDSALMQLAAEMQAEIELRGLPDLSFKQGYKAGFVAALRDKAKSTGQPWSPEQTQALHAEIERRFAA